MRLSHIRKPYFGSRFFLHFLIENGNIPTIREILPSCFSAHQPMNICERSGPSIRQRPLLELCGSEHCFSEQLKEKNAEIYLPLECNFFTQNFILFFYCQLLNIF